MLPRLSTMFLPSRVRRFTRSSSLRGTRGASVIEQLEGRQLFAVGDPGNTQIRFTTELGNIDIELFDAVKPITVTNFLKYVTSGRLNTTIIHRATEPSTGLEVLQGGGYAPPSFQHITTDDLSGTGIQNEASLDPILSNTRGTISMARTSDPNSATSEFFINVVDNASLDPASQPPGYAVFGEVINNTLSTVDAIAALPTFAFQDPFGEIPLRNYTQSDFTSQKTPTSNNFVSVTASVLSSAGQSVVTLGGAGGLQSVSFTDADGTKSTVSLKGPGTASVTVTGTGLTQQTLGKKVAVSGTASGLGSIDVIGGTTATAVTVSGKGGDGAVALGGFSADSGLKSLSAKPASLTGFFNIAGPIGKLDLGAVNSTSLTLGGQPTDKPGAVSMGIGTGVNVESGMPLKSFTASSLAAGGTGTGTITAPSLDTLTVKGNTTENVDVTGAIKKVSIAGDFTGNLGANTIGSVAVKGALSSATIVSDRAFAAAEKPLGKITVGGAMTGSVIVSAGNITSISAASSTQSTIFAGVASSINPNTLPAQASDYTSPATISSVKIKTTTADTNIAAVNLGKIALGTITTSNSGTAFGLGADKIAAVTATVASGKLNLKTIDTTADVQAQTANLTLEDFKIQVI